MIKVIVETATYLAILWILALLFYLPPLHAQEIKPGLAPYGIQHKSWPCKASIKLFGDEPIRISYLHNTFKTRKKPNSCIKKFIKTGRLEFIEVALINDVCTRWGTCGKYEFLYGMSVKQVRNALKNENKKFLKRMKRYSKPVADFLKTSLDPGTECFINPFLETNVSRDEGKVFLETLGPLFEPRCKLVWNPVGNNPNGKWKIPGYHHELHGSKESMSAPCIANLDGEDIKFVGGPKPLKNHIDESEIPFYFQKYKHCEAAMLWTRSMNGISLSGFIDPRERTEWPSKSELNKLGKYIRQDFTAPPPPGKPPKGCKQKLADGAGGNLWKQSDHHPGAVLLLHQKYQTRFKTVKVLRGKKVIDKLKFTGWANPVNGKNRQHWRSNKSLSEFPQRQAKIKADKKCFFMGNARRRID